MERSRLGLGLAAGDYFIPLSVSDENRDDVAGSACLAGVTLSGEVLKAIVGQSHDNLLVSGEVVVKRHVLVSLSPRRFRV